MVEDASGEAEARFGLGKSLLFSAILILFFFGAMELAVRGWAHYLREDVERFDPETGTFVLIPGEYEGGVRINSAGFVGPELAPPGRDLWRIYSLGDSCTYGGGVPEVIYTTFLQHKLAESGSPDVRYEVVNGGISGLNSELALRRLRTRVPAIEPDVVTIYVGWNDLMKFDPVAQGTHSDWSGVARALDHLWLVKGLRKLMFFYLRPRLRPPATGPESRSGRFAEFQPTLYAANLREIVSTAREMGAAPVVATLPTVLREDMGTSDLRRARVVFPYFPSAYGVGDLMDLVGAYNRTIRRIAEEQGVPLADLAEAFSRPEDPIPLFTDTMHLTHSGMDLVANVLLDTLQRSGLDRPALR